MANITIRWAGAADAASGSTYKIERTVDNSNWSELDAAQAATSPYAAPETTLDGNASQGATTIDLVDASGFSASGYGWLDDALIQWTGKSSNQLTGVVWHSGYGTYASGSAVYEAHESYADTGVTISYNAVLYRITHTDPSGNVSPPAYLWYYSPPVPASSQHCVVIVPVGADLGVLMQADATVTCQLAADDQFALASGPHLDQNEGTANSQTTNVFGLAFFHCWRNSAREGQAGAADAAYTFTLKPGSGALTVTVTTIPDLDWVLLSQVADAA